MINVFEEWNEYARKKMLKNRLFDIENAISNSALKIVSITGIRRCGKTSLLILVLQKLLQNSKKVAYVNIEDSRIKDSKTVLDDVLKWFGDKGYILLDEITAVYDWEGWLARNHELLKGNLNLIVSSSLRKLVLPQKQLRGRIISYELYPLSFREFLKFKNIELEKTTAGIGKIEKALEEYLVYGGFPEVVLVDEKTDKVRLIDSYFKDIISLDVADMANENISTVELFGKYVINTTYFSASKCLNFFKSVGHKIGKQSILELEKFSQDAYLFFFVPIFSYSIKDKAQYPRKDYIGDTGFLNAISGKTDMGRLYENAVFLELKRRIGLQQEINYWKNKEGAETDFVVSKGLKVEELIQVVYEMEDEKTREREIKGLVECAKEIGLKRGLIITKDIEGSKHIDGIEINFVPLRNWLLKIQ